MFVLALCLTAVLCCATNGFAYYLFFALTTVVYLKI